MTDARDAVGDATLCAGAPRDAGIAQGTGFAAPLHREFGDEGPWTRLRARLGWRRAADAAVARDARRHFPHQAELLAGIASGSRLPLAWVEQAQARALVGGVPRLAHAAAARAARTGGRATAGFLALRVTPEAVVRRSRPEGRFASVEVTLPWLSAPLAGVNEAGLAVACFPGAGPLGSCRAPAPLLALDCLQRFDQIEAALDWCVVRPAGGRATLFFGDARGEVAGIEVVGEERRVLRPADGLLVVSRGRGSESEIAKSLREDAPRDLAGLERALGGGGRAGALAVADPADRRVGLLRRTGAAADASSVLWFPV